MTTFKIIMATMDGITLSISAKGCIQTGTRNDEYRKEIPIDYCRGVSVLIPIADLPEKDKLVYIKQKVEDAYNALPDETIVKQLIDKRWTT